ncbi:hypothetical protein WG66_013446 [Moniliophthora roreri]|nr:hypothetical protein WG66_013446 [Moniliophthora roreri]
MQNGFVGMGYSGMQEDLKLDVTHNLNNRDTVLPKNIPECHLRDLPIGQVVLSRSTSSLYPQLRLEFNERRMKEERPSNGFIALKNNTPNHTSA